MSRLAKAGIVAVGSELLTPSRVDTNSLLITEALNRLGVDVVTKAIVGDSRDELAHVVRSMLARADLLVLCGGLGPTDDDVTREVVAGVLNRVLVEEPAITERIRMRFAARGWTMPEINRRQAMVPNGADVLPNELGTAPGLWIEEGDKVLVLLPGPPRELKPMVEALVEGQLGARAAGGALARRVIRITGRTESHTDEALRPLYTAWSTATPAVEATILAALGQIEVHLSARAPSLERAEAALADAAAAVGTTLGTDAYSLDGRTLEEVVGGMLAERSLRVGCAESCTGGLITSRLTDVAGSSRYVDRSIVAYSNEAKVELLGVPEALIQAHGAVSEPVAIAMADGIRTRARVDVGIGVTGIAGPGGGTPDKPVGMVAVAAVTAGLTRVRTFQFIGGREQVKFQASQAALDMIRRLLLQP